MRRHWRSKMADSGTQESGAAPSPSRILPTILESTAQAPSFPTAQPAPTRVTGRLAVTGSPQQCRQAGPYDSSSRKLTWLSGRGSARGLQNLAAPPTMAACPPCSAQERNGALAVPSRGAQDVETIRPLGILRPDAKGLAGATRTALAPCISSSLAHLPQFAYLPAWPRSVRCVGSGGPSLALARGPPAHMSGTPWPT